MLKAHQQHFLLLLHTMTCSFLEFCAECENVVARSFDVTGKSRFR